MSSALELLQNDIAQRILSWPVLADVPVLIQRQGITENDVNIAVETLNERSGKIGVVIVVLMPSADVETPNETGPRLTVKPALQVIECPELNLGPDGIGLSAEDICLYLLNLLHHFNRGFGSVINAAHDAIQPLPPKSNRVSYVVNFSIFAKLSKALRVALPTISPAGGVVPQTVTLACATAGASIYFTTDDSFPCSANPAATLYTAPFDMTTAGRLRVAAELFGLQPSDVVYATFTGTSTYSEPQGFSSGFSSGFF